MPTGLNFKIGVVFKEMTPALKKIIDHLFIIVQSNAPYLPTWITVTSVNDGIHSKNSRHYTNEALDIRSKTFKTQDDKLFFINMLRMSLGPKFTVLFEDVGKDNEHFHVQVKKGIRFKE